MSHLVFFLSLQVQVCLCSVSNVWPSPHSVSDRFCLGSISTCMALPWFYLSMFNYILVLSQHVWLHLGFILICLATSWFCLNIFGYILILSQYAHYVMKYTLSVVMQFMSLVLTGLPFFCWLFQTNSPDMPELHITGQR